MPSSDSKRKIQTEVLEPTSEPDLAKSNFLAVISQYTERPDLLIDTLEKHDPGFVKRMNAAAQNRAEKSSAARFRFGQIQAYVGLGIASIASLLVIGALFFMIFLGHTSILAILGLAVFFAVTQGGASGFMTIIRSIATMVGKGSSKG